MNLGLQLCIYVITWNVNTQESDYKVDIDNLLQSNISSSFNEQNYTRNCNVPDIYAIGFQEVKVNTPNLLKRFIFKEDAWITKFRNKLSSKDYVVIKSKQMQGILLALFVQRKHLLHIRNIEAESTKTGFGGLWGNKGAVSIRINLYSSSIAFVNAHLPAHDDGLDSRINDYNYIIKQHYYHVPYNREIFDHDYVFWFGDLNFRLNDVSLSAKDIKNMIDDNQLDELFERDQLSLVRREQKAFHQFNEEKPKFRPTFKYYLGTSEYNLKRRPSWTDRILYKIKDETMTLNYSSSIQQISYDSHSQYEISDHKPVTGIFLANVFKTYLNDIIEFTHIEQWKLGQENLIEYTIPDNFIEQEGDWIGLYPHDFSSLNDYLADVYANIAIKDNNKRYIKLEFSENVNLHLHKSFHILYISASYDAYSICGISNSFESTFDYY